MTYNFTPETIIGVKFEITGSFYQIVGVREDQKIYITCGSSEEPWLNRTVAQANQAFNTGQWTFLSSPQSEPTIQLYPLN